MKTNSRRLLPVCGVLFVLLPLTAAAQAPGDAVPDHYIVQLAPGVNSIAAAAQRGVVASRHFSRAMNGYAAVLPPGLVRQIAQDPDVLAVVPDRIVTAVKGKPGGGGGGGGGGSSQTVPEGVKRIGAAPGANGAITGAGVGVAIVDSGIDFGHQDLAPSAIQFNGLTGADPGNAQDDNGHGTHVAGTVAALHNTADVVGVAPGATLYAVKVLDAQGSGFDSEVIAGLDWILANGAAVTPSIRVVNMSLGRPLAPGETADNTIMREPIDNLAAAGITVVVAAGNDCGLDAAAQVPGAIPSVITVGATTAKTGTSAIKQYAPIAADTAAYFTSDGAGVAVSAPGEDQENILKGFRLSSVGILSTALGGGTVRYSGTSMASPHVAGVAALLYQQNAGLAPEQVLAKLQAGVVGAGVAPLDGITTCYTFDGVREGVVNVPGALAAP